MLVRDSTRSISASTVYGAKVGKSDMEALPEGYSSEHVGGLRFGDQQITLNKVLQEKQPLLSSMYLGALYVLNASTNPDRLALAGHGLRELMEKLPRYLDVPLASDPSHQKNLTTMTDKVRQLETHWIRAQEKSTCHSNPGWSGPIDKPLFQFLAKVEEFFVWIATERPSRKQQTATALRKLDPLLQALPGPIEKYWIKEWDSCREYFEGVAHHTITPSFEELLAQIAVLERFLLERLLPRTFDDYNLIDQIIREGEADAQS